MAVKNIHTEDNTLEFNRVFFCFFFIIIQNSVDSNILICINNVLAGICFDKLDVFVYITNSFFFLLFFSFFLTAKRILSNIYYNKSYLSKSSVHANIWM